VVSDDIAVFVNGVCSGRHPAPIPDKSEPDIDYPVALVSDSAVEVTDLEVVSIKPREFVRREAVDAGDPNAPPSSPDSPNDSGSNASGGESGGGGGRGGGGKGAVIP
jgi:hypothetical protein